MRYFQGFLTFYTEGAKTTNANVGQKQREDQLTRSCVDKGYFCLYLLLFTSLKNNCYYEKIIVFAHLLLRFVYRLS
jgi:hypothetical protein